MEKEQLDVFVGFKVTKRMKEDIDMAALENMVSLSDVIRGCVLEALVKRRALKEMYHKRMNY